MIKQQSDPDGDRASEGDQISFGTVFLSTLAAAIGVQSKANKERDFASGRVAPFIWAGIIFTMLFVLTLTTIVRMVIGATG